MTIAKAAADEPRGPDINRDHELRRRSEDVAAALLALWGRYRTWLLLYLPDGIDGAAPIGPLTDAQATAASIVNDAWARATAEVDLGASIQSLGDLLDAAARYAVEVTAPRIGATPDDAAALADQVQRMALERAGEMFGVSLTAGVPLANPDAARVIADTVRDQLVNAVADQIQQAASRDPASGGGSSPEAGREPAPLNGKRAAAAAVAAVTAMGDAHVGATAANEVITIANRAADALYTATGLVAGAYWMTSGLENTCGVCIGNELAGLVPLGQAFPSGDVAPAAHPNCACWLKLEIKASPQEVGAQLPFDLGKANSNHDPSNGRFTSGGLSAFLAGGLSGTRVVARLPQDIQAHLGSKSARLLLSAETVATHGHHKWTVADFARLQGVLDHGEVRADRKNHVVVAHQDGEWWVAVLKVTSDRKTTYLQSFRRSNVDQIERIGVRGPLVRGRKGY